MSGPQHRIAEPPLPDDRWQHVSVYRWQHWLMNENSALSGDGGYQLDLSKCVRLKMHWPEADTVE